MTRRAAALLLGLAGGLVAGCGGRTAAAPVRSSVAAPARLPALVSTEQLAAWLRRGPVSVVDVRPDVFTYLEGHLPGAVYVNTETLRAAEGGIPTQLFDGPGYAALFGRLGIPPDQPVVIYSAGESRNIDATFLAWLLAGFGHGQVYLLDGGYFKWEFERRPIAREYPRLAATRFAADRFRPERASQEEVRRAVRTGDALLVDARPPDQFAGEAGAQMRRGHIPGAVNHYWRDDLTTAADGYVWKPLGELRAAYEAQGITPDRDIITYCNSALESSHVAFALRYRLGYPRVRVYVGSWTEWAERTELPMETGS